MSSIKFSHFYNKLRIVEDYVDNWSITKRVTLLEVIPIELGELSQCFLGYDTEGKFTLPKSGKYLMLILQRIEDKGIFTTLRPASPGKIDYYRDLIGDELRVVVNG